ncbi:hypothetical protein BH24DEI2_BH24DEI2_20680 [soil metagenome]
MSQTIEAVFDGEALRPTEPLGLEPSTRVRVTLEVQENSEKPTSFLQVVRLLELEGPADWSAQVNEYLSKRQTF